MLAEAAPLPDPGEEDGWAYEMKWDGVRAVVYVEGARVRTLSRTDRDVSVTYPEVAGLADVLGVQAVLDGEIVAVDAEGRPDFGLLQQRMHVTDPGQVRRLVREVPAVFFAFDVLHLDGRSTLAAAYEERRALLDSLHLSGPHWQTPPGFLGDGAAALATSQAMGLEGVVAKLRDSAYHPGRRSGLWRKVKTLRTQDVVIGGWKPGEGRRSGGIGSLLLGVYEGDALVYAGHVGTGFTAAMLEDLLGRLRPLERTGSPFAGEVPRPYAREARWVEPRLVGEVAFGAWTRDARLRHPSWRGLRADKQPRDVVREP